MSKAATLKDVLYGLEYMGQELCRWPSPGNAKTPAWSLEPGGLKVSAHVADKARLAPGITLGPSSKFGESRYIYATPELRHA